MTKLTNVFRLRVDCLAPVQRREYTHYMPGWFVLVLDGSWEIDGDVINQKTTTCITARATRHDAIPAYNVNACTIVLCAVRAGARWEF